MSVTIQGVPGSISRDVYVRTIENLGLDPDLVTELRWQTNGISATVYAVDENGAVFTTTHGPERVLATHQIFIRVVDKGATP